MEYKICNVKFNQNYFTRVAKRLLSCIKMQLLSVYDFC